MEFHKNVMEKVFFLKIHNIKKYLVKHLYEKKFGAFGAIVCFESQLKYSIIYTQLNISRNAFIYW